ncbi:MAG: hypothetical protein KJ961_04710, partial [Alphaproteobacteria bacterium]|nr:hypothetical protein [Alphaproteobacteria bacterium]
MKILVLHNIEDFRRARRSALDYVLSFQRYQPEHVYHYQRILDPPSPEVVAADWDAVILGSTALGIVTIRPHETFFRIRDQWGFLKDESIVKLVFPQDDANCGGFLDDWFSDWGVQFVFTVRAREHWPVLYPRTLQSAEFRTCFSGYIDDRSLPDLRAHAKPWAERSRKLGQRVTMYPPRGGRQGRLKGLIAEAVKAAAAKRGIAADISTDPSDTIYGDDWYRFLGDCQFVLATEGGLSIHDPYGEIAGRIDAYLSHHPGAAFDEIESACFAGLDGQHVFSGFSPRILEAAVCGASQVLVEGDYLGVLQPGVHYLSVKADGSNIDEVLSALGDETAARARIAACDEALVHNPTFHYSALAGKALAAIAEKAGMRSAPPRPFDVAAAQAGYIDRLAQQERAEGFRWPELGRRVAGKVAAQIVPAGEDAPDPDIVFQRAFVQVFQSELGRLAARATPGSPSARFAATFKAAANAWQGLAATVSAESDCANLKTLSETFAGLCVNTDDAVTGPEAVGSVLAAFGAPPSQAAFVEEAAHWPPGSDIMRFARAALNANLAGLSLRLAPASGNGFTSDEVVERRQLDTILVRASESSLADIERFQEYGAAARELLDVLSEGGDAARAIMAFAAARTELLSLLCRLAPAQGAMFTPDEIEYRKRLDTLLIRAGADGLEHLSQVQSYGDQAALLIDLLSEGGDPVRALLALAESRGPLLGLLSRLAPADGYTFTPEEIAARQALDSQIVRSIFAGPDR